MAVAGKPNPLKTGPQATRQSDLDAIAKLDNARKKLEEEIAKVTGGHAAQARERAEAGGLHPSRREVA